MKPHETERRLIGIVLRYGNDAARLCLPQLTPDKFIFNYQGNFGIDHKLVWSAIRDVFLNQKLNPTLNAVKDQLPKDDLPVLLEMEREASQCDTNEIQQLTNRIDKQGIVYHVAHDSRVLGAVLDATDRFLMTVDSIQDVESWGTEQLNKIRNNLSSQSLGYEHISTVTERLRQRWEDIYSGKVVPVLNAGMPILRDHALFCSGEIAVIHGLSGSGKSTLVFQVNLGVAIDLYNTGRKGCVTINSLEMSAENLVERMASILAKVNVSKWKTRSITADEYDRLLEWSDFVDKLPIFIDDTSFLTTTAMQYRATGLHVSEHGPVVQLSSDYGELFADDHSSKEQAISKVFREQFYLSREIGASILAISQSTNDKSVSGRSYIAGPDGTRYSSGILHQADVLAELWNPVQIEKSGRIITVPKDANGNNLIDKTHPWLLLQKYRGADIGAPIPLGWIPETTTFFDLSLSQAPGKEIVYEHLPIAVNKHKGITMW